MNVLQSWSNSLAILKPANLKLFLLVTLKSIVETYKVLFTKFWWAVLIFIALDFITFLNISSNGPLLFLRTIIEIFVYFLLYLLIRPSVQKKDVAYVKGYGRYFLNDLLFLGVIFVGMMIVITASMVVHVAGRMSGDMLLIDLHAGLKAIGALFSRIYVLVVPFYYFFFLDSDGRFLSMWHAALRALIMVLYTVPFVVVVYVLNFAIEYAISYADIKHILITFMKFPQFLVMPGGYEVAYIDALFDICIFLGMPLLGCLLNNFYIKNIHEQFDLYFEKKGE